MISDVERDAARRRAIFEAHILDCEDCVVREGYRMNLCMSGEIMTTNYINALRVARVKP